MKIKKSGTHENKKQNKNDKKKVKLYSFRDFSKKFENIGGKERFTGHHEDGVQDEE